MLVQREMKYVRRFDPLRLDVPIETILYTLREKQRANAYRTYNNNAIET